MDYFEEFEKRRDAVGVSQIEVCKRAKVNPSTLVRASPRTSQHRTRLTKRIYDHLLGALEDIAAEQTEAMRRRIRQMRKLGLAGGQKEPRKTPHQIT